MRKVLSATAAARVVGVVRLINFLLGCPKMLPNQKLDLNDVFPHIVSAETIFFFWIQYIRPKVTVHKGAETIQGKCGI